MATHHNGITNLIVHDHNTWDDIQKQILSSGVNSKLDLLMAGPVPPNPGELVTRASLDDIISQLKEHYDYVILDTAPVGLVNDSLQDLQEQYGCRGWQIRYKRSPSR